MRRPLLALVALSLVGLLCYAAGAFDQVRPPATASASRATGDSHARAALPPPANSEAEPDVRRSVDTATDAEPEVPWSEEALAKAAKDPHWHWPAEERPHMHWVINNGWLKGLLQARHYALRVDKMLADADVNPDHKQVSAATQKELQHAIAALDDETATLERAYWVALETDYHRAIERGDYQKSDNVLKEGATLQEKTAPTGAGLATLDARYGSGGYFYIVAAITPLNAQGLVYVTRTTAPDAFAAWDRMAELRKEARRSVRDFVARL